MNSLTLLAVWRFHLTSSLYTFAANRLWYRKDRVWKVYPFAMVVLEKGIFNLPVVEEICPCFQANWGWCAFENIFLVPPQENFLPSTFQDNLSFGDRRERWKPSFRFLPSHLTAFHAKVVDFILLLFPFLLLFLASEGHPIISQDHKLSRFEGKQTGNNRKYCAPFSIFPNRYTWMSCSGVKLRDFTREGPSCPHSKLMESFPLVSRAPNLSRVQKWIEQRIEGIYISLAASRIPRDYSTRTRWLPIPWFLDIE